MKMKWGMAVALAVTLGATPNAHAFFEFSCRNNEVGKVLVRETTPLTGSNLLREIFRIISPCDRRRPR